MKKYEKILVSGGCGFIGSNLVHRMVKSGFFIRVFDNMSRGKREWIIDPDVDIIEGDIRDPKAVRNAMAGIDSIIHLAAYGSVVESLDDPLSNFKQNVEGTFTLLEEARKAKIKKIIFASTGGALIGDTEPPVNEYSVPKPISPYGASKLCGEAYCHAYGKSFGICTVALRFANAFGPNSVHKKGAVTAFIKALMAGKPIVIYGNGSASRDFLYVEDVCKGIEQALIADVNPGSVFHLASGVETRIGELAIAVAVIGGYQDYQIEYREHRRGEVNRNFARYDLAKEVLGFEPDWPIDKGLNATWAWFREQYKTDLPPK